MTKKKNAKLRAPLPKEQREDAKRLFVIWNRLKEQNPKGHVSQLRFGADHNIGTQGLIHQYLNGIIPLNLAVSTKFAKGLNCKIQDFSPSIAKLVQDAIPYATASLIAKNDSEIQLLAMFRRLTVPEHRDQLLGMAVRLANEERADLDYIGITADRRKPKPPPDSH